MRRTVVGIGRERKQDETRVGLTPAGAAELVRSGHGVLVERGAGAAAAFPDESYVAAGAAVVDTAGLYREADLVVKVKSPLPDEVAGYRAGQVLFTYLHLDENAPPEFSRQLAATGVDAIAYEWVRQGDRYVLLAPMSKLTGAVFARRALEILMDRKGVLGGAYTPGAVPATVLLIGGGTIGMNALNVFLRNRTRVEAFDKHPETFAERAARIIPPHVLDETADLLAVHRSDEVDWLQTRDRIAETLTRTDILFCAAVRRPTMPKSACEYLVTRAMLERMPPHGVVIEATACDQDLVETAVSSPRTRHVYCEAGQWHYNCDHVPALVPVTATRLLTDATFPFVRRLADLGFEAAVRQDPALAGAVMCTRGRLTHRYTCDKKGLDFTNLEEALGLPPVQTA